MFDPLKAIAAQALSECDRLLSTDLTANARDQIESVKTRARVLAARIDSAEEFLARLTANAQVQPSPAPASGTPPHRPTQDPNQWGHLGAGFVTGGRQKSGLRLQLAPPSTLPYGKPVAPGAGANQASPPGNVQSDEAAPLDSKPIA